MRLPKLVTSVEPFFQLQKSSTTEQERTTFPTTVGMFSACYLPDQDATGGNEGFRRVTLENWPILLCSDPSVSNSFPS